MLEHIEITGEGGIIRLKWEWDDSGNRKCGYPL